MSQAHPLNVAILIARLSQDGAEFFAVERVFADHRRLCSPEFVLEEQGVTVRGGPWASLGISTSSALKRLGHFRDETPVLFDGSLEALRMDQDHPKTLKLVVIAAG
ncbi:MAG: hypothetical protein R3313_00510 [Candidatus Saccharimonadales bacterium]|nr:hypothetical protein [Candidatus Saccharimonadales bacterium]